MVLDFHANTMREFAGRNGGGVELVQDDATGPYGGIDIDADCFGAAQKRHCPFVEQVDRHTCAPFCGRMREGRAEGALPRSRRPDEHACRALFQPTSEHLVESGNTAFE